VKANEGSVDEQSLQLWETGIVARFCTPMLT